MRWSFALVFVVALASLVTCTPVQHSKWVASDAATDGHHFVRGVGTRDGRGHPYIRREVNDLAQNYPDQWALYLLGLRRFQQVDQDDPLSYYGIAGIHGRPYKIWQNASGAPGYAVGAYCPHSSRLFLTWHRPYLALFEQALWKHVRSVADQAREDRERWSAAADAFRIPYWDTARGDRLPSLLISPRWPINGPNGTQLVDNPLFWYEFHPLRPGDFPNTEMASYNRTMRWPTSHHSDAKPQVAKFAAEYPKNQRGRQDAVYAAFNHNNASFNEFSIAVENLHGEMHLMAGGYEDMHGHMMHTEYSAFDPIFWLHHANVDRLMALYMIANPGLWLTPEVVDNNKNWGTFWNPKGAFTDANTSLVPFWKNEGAFYSAEDVRNVDVLGYAYPETQHWNFASDEEWRNDVKNTVQGLYPHSARIILENAVATGSDLHRLVEEGNIFMEWVVEAKACATEMPSTFVAIFSLVGDFSSDQSTQVGVWAQMVPESPETGAWKARQAERTAKRSDGLDQGLKTTISLTSILLDQITAGRLASLDPDVVVPYLKTHLTWNVYAGMHQQRMTPDQLDSFTVEVTSRKVRIPNDLSKPLQHISDTTSYLMNGDGD